MMYQPIIAVQLHTFKYQYPVLALVAALEDEEKESGFLYAAIAFLVYAYAYAYRGFRTNWICRQTRNDCGGRTWEV
jgi:hypothetical protein